mmetsp:Transcript_16047/g.19967  ORF Transcript_16047/g.19967 Transcript_16047/m.19967 type:complete len:219 (-) Transcript_16047:228-884(-)
MTVLKNVIAVKGTSSNFQFAQHAIHDTMNFGLVSQPFFSLIIYSVIAPVVKSAPPVITIETDPLQFSCYQDKQNTAIVNDTPLPISSSLTITDADSTSLSSAQVSITSGFTPGDSLAFDATYSGSITGQYNAATGVMSLTGTASLSDYEMALRSVTFDTTAPLEHFDPVYDGSRTLSVGVVDDSAESSIVPATRNIDVSTAYRVFTDAWLGRVVYSGN